jgi:glycerophosphoryl diester phosphodiesterase
MNFFAHRGYSSRYPQNSYAAFEAALRHPRRGGGLAGIEMDIHATLDQCIVVMHETAIVGRDGREHAVSSLDQSTLDTLFERGRGHPLPRLAEVLHRVDHGLSLCLEIKEAGYDRDAFNRRLAALLWDYRPAGDIIVSSFSVACLESAMAATRGLDIRFGALFDSWDAWDRLPAACTRRIHYMHPRWDLLVARPERLRTATHPVQCWTVNDPSDIERLRALPGAKAIHTVMTDDIGLVDRMCG